MGEPDQSKLTAIENADQAEFGRFWEFALSVYSTEAFQDACLRLQDEYGADVIVLLFLLWRGLSREIISTEILRDLLERTEPWTTEVVRPLRQVRREMKRYAAEKADDALQKLRSRVKADELEAERIQMRTLVELWAHCQPAVAASPAAAILENVAGYQKALRREFPASLLDVVVNATENR